jgi:FtsP/CotA-like multicopper oxidase with cupredoxin domain
MLNHMHAVRSQRPAPDSRPKLVSIVAVDGWDDSSLLSLAGRLAGSLETTVTAAIVESARERQLEMGDVDQVHHTMPSGVAAVVGGRTVVLGNAAHFSALGLSIDNLGDSPERLTQRGEEVLFVAVDGRTAGFLGIADRSECRHPNAEVMEDEMRDARSTADQFPTSTADLPTSRPVESIELADGEQFNLHIAPVIKRLGDTTVRMLAYNGSIPGPTLRVEQGSEVLINVLNEGDLEATVHWHGLRLDNRYDGTLATQAPIAVGGAFSYRLTFPDPGIYWYHPHIREDYGQEMGLYGNIIVVPSEPDYWPAANRDIALTLDDILLEEGQVAPFSRRHPTYTAMGRFGNVLLVNGEPQPSLVARFGEVVRFYLTNTANTRVFNVGLHGARMKLVGGDSGRYERETFVESVIIAPSERVVVDVLFDRPGAATLEHRTPGRTYSLAAIEVGVEPAEPSLAAQFASLRTNADMTAARARMADFSSAEPDKTLALIAEMDMGEPQVPSEADVEYVCPMHADVISGVAGRCPTCGMKLMARQAAPATFACPMHPDIRSTQPDRCPKCGMKLVPSQLVKQAGHGESHHAHAEAAAHRDHRKASDGAHPQVPAGIEWEDDMVDVNRMTNPTNMRWKLIDRETGAEGSAVDWRFRVGQQVKIRLVNEMDSDHPMHHPFHIHGAGRFLILSRDGNPESNLVWKDTVLVRTGETVDILLDVTRPGMWMAHCHIAEHHESGMMFSFRVDQ